MLKIESIKITGIKSTVRVPQISKYNRFILIVMGQHVRKWWGCLLKFLILFDSENAVFSWSEIKIMCRINLQNFLNSFFPFFFPSDILAWELSASRNVLSVMNLGYYCVLWRVSNPGLRRCCVKCFQFAQDRAEGLIHCGVRFHDCQFEKFKCKVVSE